MDNTLRKAAEMALEYLEYLNELDIAGLDHEVHTNALRQALAQPEQNKRVCNTCNGTGIVKGLHNWAGGGKRTESCWACHEVAQPEQEPVAEVHTFLVGSPYAIVRVTGEMDLEDELFLAAPPSKPWVGLTMRDYHEFLNLGTFEAFKAIEAALKEKNNG